LDALIFLIAEQISLGSVLSVSCVIAPYWLLTVYASFLHNVKET